MGFALAEKIDFKWQIEEKWQPSNERPVGVRQNEPVSESKQGRY